MMSEMLLTVEQAAARLQLTSYTVRLQLRAGRLRGVKRGRVWRVPESALLEPTPISNVSNGNPTQEAPAELPDLDVLLDATGAAMQRAGYHSDAAIERLIAQVRAELGHDGPRRALREKRASEATRKEEQKATTGARKAGARA